MRKKRNQKRAAKWMAGCIVIMMAFVFTACAQKTEEKNMYQSISMEDAAEVFKTEGDYIILDVRHADEFAEGHIPEAINLDNDNIGTDEIELLPDKKQTIYVYCRSGNRSRQAAAKLVEQGYENIIECGGILDWTGETER